MSKPFEFALHTTVPADVVTAVSTLGTALQAAVSPQHHDALVQALGSLEAMVNVVYPEAR